MNYIHTFIIKYICILYLTTVFHDAIVHIKLFSKIHYKKWPKAESYFLLQILHIDQLRNHVLFKIFLGKYNNFVATLIIQ